MAVGFDGWAKGGDVNDYSAAIVVSPKAQLGIVVIGASGFGSTISTWWGAAARSVVSLPAGSGLGYMILFGDPGQAEIHVTQRGRHQAAVGEQPLRQFVQKKSIPVNVGNVWSSSVEFDSRQIASHAAAHSLLRSPQ